VKPSSEPGKGKGALVALLASAPRSSSKSDDSSSDLEMDETDHGFRAVAKAFGIPPEREAAAKDALKQYVRSCVGSSKVEDEEEY
jgi:hypothetical protein